MRINLLPGYVGVAAYGILFDRQDLMSCPDGQARLNMFFQILEAKDKAGIETAKNRASALVKLSAR